MSLKFDSASKMLSTTIEDTGIGMNSDQQQKVGMLFKRSACKTVLNPQGLGLGLYLSKTLTNQLGGELTVDSILGKGTIASFTLKCDDSRDPITPSTDELRANLSSRTLPELTRTLSCNCPRVLLVDDEPFNLLVFSAYLSSVNVIADKAVNGKLALDLIEKRATQCECCKGYSLIFMDINMPVMDGIECTTQIVDLIHKGTIPECKIVAVTAAKGLDKAEVHREYISKGFQELCIDFLKPLLLLIAGISNKNSG